MVLCLPCLVLLFVMGQPEFYKNHFLFYIYSSVRREWASSKCGFFSRPTSLFKKKNIPMDDNWIEVVNFNLLDCTDVHYKNNIKRTIVTNAIFFFWKRSWTGLVCRANASSDPSFPGLAPGRGGRTDTRLFEPVRNSHHSRGKTKHMHTHKIKKKKRKFMEHKILFWKNFVFILKSLLSLSHIFLDCFGFGLMDLPWKVQ